MTRQLRHIAASVGTVAGPSPRPRPGQTRLERRMLVDDAGPYYSLGATVLNLLHWWEHDQGRMRKNLAFLAKYLTDDVRPMTTLGWPTHEVDPRRPGYDQRVAECLDVCYDEFGMRWAPSLTGPDYWFNGDVKPAADHIARVASIFNTRRSKLAYAEVVNEADVVLTDYNTRNTPGGRLAWLETTTRRAIKEMPWLVSGATSDMVDYPPDRSKQQGVAETLKWGPQAVISQPPRTPSDDGLYQAMVPHWGWRLFPVANLNNEPPGPGSSGWWEYDPVRLALQRAANTICGSPAWVLHNGSGIEFFARGGDRFHPEVQDNLWETPNIDNIMAAVSGVSQWFPARGCDGHYMDMHLQASFLRCDGGAYRGWYSALSDYEAWAVVGGIKGVGTALTSERRCQVTAFDLIRGPIGTGELGPGKVWTVQSPSRTDKGHGAVILRVEYDTPPDLPPAPVTTEEWRLYYEDVRHRYGLSSPTVEAHMTLDALMGYYGTMLQQNQNGDYRGRFYLPSPDPVNPYSRAVDYVDGGGGWTWLVR